MLSHQGPRGATSRGALAFLADSGRRECDDGRQGHRQSNRAETETRQTGRDRWNQENRAVQPAEALNRAEQPYPGRTTEYIQHVRGYRVQSISPREMHARMTAACVT